MGLSGVQRTLKFIKYLPDNGWQPIVLTCRGDSYYKFDDTLLDDLPEEAIIYRTDEKSSGKNKEWIYPPQWLQKIRRAAVQAIMQPDSRRPWLKHALIKADEIIKEHIIDAVFATAPPFTSFMAAREINKRYGIPYLLDYRDLWLDNAYYFYATPFHKNYAAGHESEILLESSKALVISRYMKEKLLQRYKFLGHEDVKIIPHGYDPEDFEAAGEVFSDNEFFDITHSGLFPDDLTPKYFLKGYSKFLENNPDAKKRSRAVFVGLMRKSHEKYIRRYGLESNVVLKGYVSHLDAVREIKKADLLWIMIPNIIVTPSRLYEYIGSRKPVLIMAPEGNMRSLVRDSGACFEAPLKDTAKIAGKIEEAWKLWLAGKLPSGDNKNAGIYNRKNLTSELARELALAIKF